MSLRLLRPDQRLTELTYTLQPHRLRVDIQHAGIVTGKCEGEMETAARPPGFPCGKNSGAGMYCFPDIQAHINYGNAVQIQVLPESVCPALRIP